jgi:hypothetical protein
MGDTNFRESGEQRVLVVIRAGQDVSFVNPNYAPDLAAQRSLVSHQLGRFSLYGIEQTRKRRTITRRAYRPVARLG